ncbi:MAG: efflux RND transporter periplasmic adaptor subunit [Planctomycetaceae bacterium]
MEQRLPSTEDLGRMKLRLVGGLLFSPQVDGAQPVYHVEITHSGKFFRIGYAEYLFLSLFDGDTTLAAAISLTARKLKSDAFSESDALRTCQWGIDNGLLEAPDAGTSRTEAKGRRELNPFWAKLPLGSPDHWLDLLLPLFSWMLSPLVVGLCVVLLTYSGLMLASSWSRYESQSIAIWDATNWLWIGLAWIGLKGVHELAHAIACKRHGGSVRETGLIFILFAPMAYVDVTSSWRFASRWQRIQVASAGMWAELVIAAVAILFWERTDSLWAGRLCIDIITMAGLSTILFNANPLMKFDGYYILSDLTGIPNLATSGSQFVTSLLRRLFLGQAVPPLPFTGCKGLFIRGYGIAAAFWKVLVTVSLGIAASVLFHGFGLLITAFGVIGWIGRPAVNAFRALRSQWSTHPGRMLRGAFLGLFITVPLAYALFVLPCPGAMSAPGIVEFTDLQVVRVATPGFIEEVLVDDGQRVEPGTLLIRLHNPELLVEYRDMILSIEQSEARRIEFANAQKVGEAQIEGRSQQSLRERLAQLQQRLDGLNIRATTTGRVIARRLDERVGTWVDEGAEVAMVGDEEHKEVLIAVLQQDSEAFRNAIGQPVRIRTSSQGMVQGIVQTVTPRATTVPIHEGLTGPYGGPLAVKSREPSESSPEESEFDLVQPMFRATLRIDPKDASRLSAGERGDARLQTTRPPAALLFYRSLTHWLEQKLQEAEELEEAE